MGTINRKETIAAANAFAADPTSNGSFNGSMWQRPLGQPDAAKTWSAPSGGLIALANASLWQTNLINTYEVTTTGRAERGFQPGGYGALWTRDHSAAVFYQPTLLSSSDLRQFVSRRLAARTQSTPNPDGGTFPDNFIPDRIDFTDVTYKNPGDGTTPNTGGGGRLPIMDGISFVILALYTDWLQTGDSTFFQSNKTVVDACLSALPRDPSNATGCVYSDPAHWSIDYGFTDGIGKTGNVAYGTALLAWSYKMLAAINGETSASGEYTAKMLAAEAGLRTLRKTTGWYAPSSLNEASLDDVWATALIVSRGLCTPDEARISAQAIANAYAAGTITQRGWVRHLPTGQYWVNANVTPDTYQNGGFWATPIVECVRAVSLVNPYLARQWANEAVAEFVRQKNVGLNAPLEWFFNTTNSSPSNQSGAAAALASLCDTAGTRAQLATVQAASFSDDFSTDTSANYTLSSVSYDSTAKAMKSVGAVDGEYFVRNDLSAADVAVKVDMKFTGTGGGNFPAVILRYTDANNYIFVALGNSENGIGAYDRVAGVNTALSGGSIMQGVAAQPNTYYTYQVWVVGNTVTIRAFDQEWTFTTSIAGAGKVGCRWGRTGSGQGYYDNFSAWTIPASGTVPSDCFVAHDGGFIAPGGSLRRPIFGNYRILDAAGNILTAGSANGAPISITSYPSLAGNLSGPDGGVTANGLVRFDATTGRYVKDSALTVDDSGNILPKTTGVGSIGSSSYKFNQGWFSSTIDAGDVIKTANSAGFLFETRGGLKSGGDGDFYLFKNDGSTYGTITSLNLRHGSGSPEGAVTAPVGTLYMRSDGGASTTLYVKESGSGNTGWIAK